jgi:hypothetical protein
MLQVPHNNADIKPVLGKRKKTAGNKQLLMWAGNMHWRIQTLTSGSLG